MEVKLCEGSSPNTESSFISFGDKSENKVCWRAQKPDLVLSEVKAVTDSLSGLLSNMWHSGADNWNSKGASDWKAVCVKSAKGWTLNQSGDKEYLGYCDETENEGKRLFLEKSKESGEKIKLMICKGECFSEQEPPSAGIKQLGERKGDWSEIKFKKNS